MFENIDKNSCQDQRQPDGDPNAEEVSLPDICDEAGDSGEEHTAAAYSLRDSTQRDADAERRYERADLELNPQPSVDRANDRAADNHGQDNHASPVAGTAKLRAGHH